MLNLRWELNILELPIQVEFWSFCGGPTGPRRNLEATPTGDKRVGRDREEAEGLRVPWRLKGCVRLSTAKKQLNFYQLISIPQTPGFQQMRPYHKFRIINALYVQIATYTGEQVYSHFFISSFQTLVEKPENGSSLPSLSEFYFMYVFACLFAWCWHKVSLLSPTGLELII